MHTDKKRNCIGFSKKKKRTPTEKEQFPVVTSALNTNKSINDW